uniref:Uncharacterized protein n=1 Tax=Caenorhabditis japonica TaxID=281687 RepID=A0A8R1EMK5_CAEJA
MFNDPSDPYLLQPQAFCGTIPALSLFYILTIAMFFYTLPLYITGSIEIFFIAVFINCLHFLTFYAVLHRLDRPLAIFYPIELFFWTFAIGYMTYAFCSFDNLSTVPTAIYAYMLVALSGLYRGILARRLHSWIEKCNREVVLLTGFHGMDKESC